MPFNAEKAIDEAVKAYLTPIELGEELRKFIKRSGKTQRQVAEEAGMSQPSYLSHMVNGRINWVESAYFPGLVTALNLSLREIRRLRPDIVTQMVSAAVEAGNLESQRHVRPRRAIPDELQQAIDLYGDKHSDLRTPEWQDYLASFRDRSIEADTPEDWLAFYRNLVRFGVKPGEES